MPDILKRTVEQWAKIKATKARQFAAAKAAHRWPEGRELTEVEYLAAITKAWTAPLY